MGKRDGERKLHNHTDWREAFLWELSRSGNVQHSAGVAGVDTKTVYNHRNRSPEFSEAWDEALEDAIQRMEAEAHRRAVHGVDKPVFHNGKECGVVRQYSDVLLMFLLKAKRPEVYRDNVSLQHSGNVQVNILDAMRNYLGKGELNGE